MAEVLSVMNPANKRVDGTMTLAPNTVAWAANDPVEQPHYYQQKVGPNADQKFKQAVDDNDMLLMSEVSTRYLHTRAGAEA